MITTLWTLAYIFAILIIAFSLKLLNERDKLTSQIKQYETQLDEAINQIRVYKKREEISLRLIKKGTQLKKVF